MRPLETRDDETGRTPGEVDRDRAPPRWLGTALAVAAVAAAAGWVAVTPAPMEAVAATLSEMRRVLAGAGAS